MHNKKNQIHCSGRDKRVIWSFLKHNLNLNNIHVLKSKKNDSEKKNLLCALKEVFSFKATMLLLKINLIHMVCFIRRYLQYVYF